MPDAFLTLPGVDRRDALAFAAAASGRPPHLLEKDVRVVWALNALFESPFGLALVFKGGTSLSKAYRVIRRFSEDIDLTFDIRALAPELVGDTPDAIPGSHAEARRWAKTIEKSLPAAIDKKIAPLLAARIESEDLKAKLRIESEKLFIDYDPTETGSGYVGPWVQLEFGARSTGEPNAPSNITCDAAEHLPTLVFPTARAQTMKAERTFWEKATAAHVFCLQSKIRERFARHWHDLVRLDDAEIAAKAIEDRALAASVAQHKTMFFREKDGSGQSIDYAGAVGGNLQLAPEGPQREALAEDYARMIEDGLLMDDGEPFDALMERCARLAVRANAVAQAHAG